MPDLTKRFTPGFILQSKGADSTPDALATALAPGFVGAFVDLPWAQIEPARGAYDFSLIRAYLAWGANNDRQLFFMPADRDFSRPAATSRIVPRWIDSVPFNKKRADSGCVARIWTAEVNSARIALLKAITREFADHPRFEALSLQETALGGITRASDEDYSHAGYCAEICRLIREVAPTLGPVQLWQSINWLGPKNGPFLDLIAEALFESGAGGLTNPDSVPWARLEKPMYAVMAAWADRLPISFGNDTSQLDRPGGGRYATFAELVALLIDFALEHKTHYIMLKESFYSHVAGGAELSKEYAAAVKQMVATKRLSPTIPLLLRPGGGGTPDPETPAIDLALLKQLLGDVESTVARLRTAMG